LQLKAEQAQLEEQMAELMSVPSPTEAENEQYTQLKANHKAVLDMRLIQHRASEQQQQQSESGPGRDAYMGGKVVRATSFGRRLSRSPLPGGFAVGDKVFFTGKSTRFSNGDAAVHPGQEGKVLGPASGEDKRRISVHFFGNKDVVECLVTSLSKDDPRLASDLQLKAEQAQLEEQMAELMSVPSPTEAENEQYTQLKASRAVVLDKQRASEQQQQQSGSGDHRSLGGKVVRATSFGRRLSRPSLPGGFAVGNKVYFTGNNMSFSSGDTAVHHGQEGKVLGPAAGECQKRVAVFFPGNKDVVECLHTSLSTSRPPLPGGFVVGDKVIFTGTGTTFSNGDTAVHNGQEGKVLGPAAGGDETRVSVLFRTRTSNKIDVAPKFLAFVYDCLLTSLSKPDFQNPAPTGTVEIEGFLWKRGSGLGGSFKKRWFFVQGGALCYSDPEGGKADVAIVCGQVIAAELVAPSQNISGHRFEFAVFTDSRTYALRANTQAELDSWNEACNRIGGRRLQQS